MKVKCIIIKYGVLKKKTAHCIYCCWGNMEQFFTAFAIVKVNNYPRQTYKVLLTLM